MSLWLGHVFLFLLSDFLLLFVVFCAIEKVTLPSLYGLALYRGRPSPISLARASEGLSHLLWGCVLSGFVLIS